MSYAVTRPILCWKEPEICNDVFKMTAWLEFAKIMEIGGTSFRIIIIITQGPLQACYRTPIVTTSTPVSRSHKLYYRTPT